MTAFLMFCLGLGSGIVLMQMFDGIKTALMLYQYKAAYKGKSFLLVDAAHVYKVKQRLGEPVNA